tara:strand:- start:10759 stop:11100 length:342 start_codon:yes stop_codon:yes gene_type:complete
MKLSKLVLLGAAIAALSTSGFAAQKYSADHQHKTTHEHQQVKREQNETGKIDINKADAAELANLKGIGPKIAATIVDYRDKHGEFKSVDELTNIRGISQRLVDDLRNQMTLTK